MTFDEAELAADGVAEETATWRCKPVRHGSALVREGAHFVHPLFVIAVESES